MTDYKTIFTAHHKGGLILWLARPEKRNAITIEMIEELTDFFSQPAGDLNFVIMAGKGECFAAGADLTAMKDASEASALEISRDLHQLSAHIGAYNAPVVAAVHGYALGGGFELALSADMLYASEEAYFAMPEMNFSLIPGGGGTQRLAEHLGKADAYYYIFTGEKLSAEFCMQRGLVQKIHNKNQLIENTINSLASVTKKTGKAAAVSLKKTIRLAGQKDGYATEAEHFAWLLNHKAKPFIEQFINHPKEN